MCLIDIHTGSITSPTKKSAAANEVSNKLEKVLSDLFLATNHKTVPFPIIVTKLARPYHVDKTTLPAMLKTPVLLVFMFALSCDIRYAVCVLSDMCNLVPRAYTPSAILKGEKALETRL